MKNKIDFDNYSADYEQLLKDQLSFFDTDNDYFSEYKIIKVKNLLLKKPRHILDFGCGIGRSIRFFQENFPSAHISGCDISEKSLSIAAKTYPNITLYKNEDLFTSTNRFDLIFLSGVLHHIEPIQRKPLFNSLAELLMPQANIIIFEHNPLNPVSRHMVNTCPFDKDAVLLRPGEIKQLLTNAGINPVRCDYTLFFPAILKKLRILEPYLRHIPLGGQYMIQGVFS